MKTASSFLQPSLLAALLLITASASSARCSDDVARGIDHSGTDYYDAKRAACLTKESKALKAAVLRIASDKPERAWQLTHALLCGKAETAAATVRRGIKNPLKTVVFDPDGREYVTHKHQTARGIMQKGCAFSPSADALSDQSVKISYIPYSPQAYCGAAFVLEFRKGDWWITEEHGVCD